MKIVLKFFHSKISKNLEFLFVLLLIVISIAITQIYNSTKSHAQKEYVNLINNLYFQKTFTNIFNNFAPKYLNVKHTVAPNENLNSIFKNYKLSEKEIEIVTKSIDSKIKKKQLKINQKVAFTINQEVNKISKLTFPISKTKKIIFIRDFNKDKFTSSEIVTNLKRKVLYKEGKIVQSLYRSAVKNKIPPNIIVEFARIYGFQVDFQRDIRRNDTYQIIYEVFEDADKKIFNSGNILFADLNLRNQSNAFYHFNDNGEDGHYDINGKSVKKALMKTPINGARLS